MSFVNLLILIITGTICVYLVVDRICRCVEQSSLTKAYGTFLKNGGTKNETLDKVLKSTIKNN